MAGKPTAVGDRLWLWATGGGSPPRVAVVEAALLVETGGREAYEVLVVVWCPAEQQIARAVERGMAEGRARALLAAQLPIDAKRAAAEVVIDNSGSPEALGAEVDRAWREVLELCAARCG